MLFGLEVNNWTIIRPYITYSSDRLQLGVLEKEAWLQRALRGKKIMFTEDIADHVTTMTYGCDVARAVIGIIGNERAYGQAVHITGDQSMKWSEILDIYLDVLEQKTGERPKVVMLNNSLDLKHNKYGAYQVKYDRLYNRVFDHTLANELCGPIAYTSMEEGLRRCLLEFMDGNREFLDLSWRYEGWADRYCGNYEKMEGITGVKSKCKYILARGGMI